MRKLTFTFIAIIFASTIFAADFQPIPPELQTKYHFDLSKNFYADQQAFDKDLAEAKSVADDLQQYKGKIGSSAKDLLTIAQKLERLNPIAQKLYVFRYLNYSIDTTTEAKFSATDQAVSDIYARVAFVSTELSQISTSDLDRLIQQEPGLSTYRFFLEQNTRYKPHTLSSDQEQLLAALSPDLSSWQSQLFQRLVDRTKFSEIETAEGKLNVYRDRAILQKNKDRNIRKDALLKLYDEYSSNADLLGFLLIKEANTGNSLGELHHFQDAFDSSLFDAYLTDKQAESFFAEIGKYASLMQKLIQVRKEHIKKISGIDPVEPWDMDVVPPDYKRPVFTITETTTIIPQALAFHGEQYIADLKRLLDPNNQRLDIVKGPNRRPGAFSMGVYGLPYFFYSYVYNGYVDDLITMAHEAGHAVHYDLIYQNKVPFVYSDGPSYFTESFAMLNEFMTLDYLYKNAKTKDDKIFYLEHWLDVAMRRFFDIVMRSEFEYDAYQKIKSGEIHEPDQVHELWKQEGLKYVGEDYQKHDFLKYNWSFTPHYFQSPRYYINYLFANLMAINYYQQHQSNPEFDKKYVALMVHGFPDTPANLLQKYLNLNPFNPQAVKDSMGVLQQKLAELQSLYGE
ncbi:MAG: hypothetical protein C5B54_08595 [Acidobacteria bacterium]|nr:MAG: hypothetical protein C5B54_08595 [Acidobacteriota bacterium]